MEGYKDSASTQNLLELGIPVDQEVHDTINPKKLAQDFIDVWITTSSDALEKANEAGFPDIEQAFVVSTREMYLAMTKDTPPNVLANIEAAFNKITDEKQN